MLIRPLFVAALVTFTSPAAFAQNIHAPAGARQLPGPVDGCRYTEWLPEAYVGPTETAWLIAWNPLPVDQYIEVTVYDDGSHSPSWNEIISATTRTSINLFPGKPIARLKAISVEVRWQYAGSSALASWPLIYDRPLALSEGKALTLCLEQ